MKMKPALFTNALGQKMYFAGIFDDEFGPVLMLTAIPLDAIRFHNENDIADLLDGFLKGTGPWVTTKLSDNQFGGEQ